MSTTDPMSRPSKDLLVWQRHHIRVLLEYEADKERLERIHQQKMQRLAMKLEQNKPTPKASPRPVKREIEVDSKATSSERITVTEPSPVEKNKYVHSRLAEIKTLRTQQRMQEEAMLDDRLRDVQRRLEHSNELHSAALQIRAQSAAQKRRRAGSLAPRKGDDHERLIAYVLQKMHSGSNSVRKTKPDDGKDAWRVKREEIAKRAADNRKTAQQAWTKRLKTIEEQEAAISTAVEARLELQRDAVMLKQWQLKERSEECQAKRRELQRQRLDRQMELLGQLAEVERKVEGIKKQRALSVEKYRDKLRSNMLVKERTYEVLSVISRSPKSKRAQEMLKLLDISR